MKMQVMQRHSEYTQLEKRRRKKSPNSVTLCIIITVSCFDRFTTFYSSQKLRAFASLT
jgi:hypothetical protein